jgi:hypothetical protein
VSFEILSVSQPSGRHRIGGDGNLIILFFGNGGAAFKVWQWNPAKV